MHIPETIVQSAHYHGGPQGSQGQHDKGRSISITLLGTATSAQQTHVRKNHGRLGGPFCRGRRQAGKHLNPVLTVNAYPSMEAYKKPLT
eukprot:scaffold79440_cov15-Tisochrysis_lutea.AAC.1